MHNCKSIFKQLLPWIEKLQTCQTQPHLVSGHFMKVFHKTTTCPRWPPLSGPKSGCLIQVWLHIYIYINCYLAAPWPNLGHYQGDSLTNPMSITAFFLSISTWRSEGASQQGWVYKPDWVPSGVWTRTLLILITIS